MPGGCWRVRLEQAGATGEVEARKVYQAAALHVAVEGVVGAAEATGCGGHIASELRRHPTHQEHARAPGIGACGEHYFRVG